MKNCIIKLLWGLLTAGIFALVSCTGEEFVRVGGKQPDGESMNGIAAQIYRTGQINNRVIMSGQEVTDMLHCRLSQPAKTDVTMTVRTDVEKVGAYNTEKGTDFEPFPAENVTLFYGKTIAAGEKESGDISVSLQRASVGKGRYLLPLTFEFAGLEDETAVQTYYCEVLVLEKAEEGEIDPWDFKVVAYVNTEEMQPIISTKFSAWGMNLLSGDEFTKTWVDITVIRPAKITRKSGTAVLELGEDMQYVLDNREQYVVPVQKLGRKVLMCINGGFRNLTDAEIGNLVYRIKYTTDKYRLDGVNFLEMDAAYGEGTPALDAGAYTKLIKATKEALGADKFVTVACDAETTGDLAAVHDGIEAGQYIDYAWCGIIDQPVDPYTDQSVLKPIAGLERSKYGSLMLKTHDTAWQANGDRDEFCAIVAPFCREHSESCNVYAFWDMPPSRSGIEQGGGEAFGILLTYILTDENCEYDCMLYGTTMSPDLGGAYGKCSKDW